jgi:diamine N-acetyltransferase
MPTTLRLEPLNATNIVAANSLTLKPGQEQYATPVSHAIAEQSINPTTTWTRVVLEGEEVVGFIKGNLDPNEQRDEFRCCVWSINVKASAQGHGVGRFAVQALAEKARSLGFDRLTVIWESGGEGSPEEFFLHLGFTPVGETQYGEVLGAMSL